MNNNLYLSTGKVFLTVSILAIGIIHIVAGHFPVGLMPVPSSLPAKDILAYLTGLLMVIAAVMVFIKKTAHYGALAAAGLYLLALLLIHIPKLVSDLHNPSIWTGVFEVVCIFAGLLILAGTIWGNDRLNLIQTGRYIFAVGLLVFGVQHLMYAQFIVGLIPAWMPIKLVLNYIVMIGFFTSGLSFLTGKQVRLAGILLGLMFLIWVFILHLPRVIANSQTEPEWTSMFVALGFSGIAFLIAGSSIPHAND